MLQTKERIAYFDVLRAFGCFFVVLIHVSADCFDYPGTNTFDWQTANFFDGISRWSVPVFVMISGAVFLNREITFERMMKKYVFRLAAAFAFWSFIYVAVEWLLGQRNYAILAEMFVRGEYHFWYISMLISLYLSTFFLKGIMKSESLTWLYLSISFALIFVFGQLAQTLYALPGRLLHIIGIGMQAVFGEMKDNAVFSTFLFYFVLGFYLNSKINDARVHRRAMILGIIGFAATVGLNGFSAVYLEDNRTLFYDYGTVNVLFESVGVFAAASVITNRISPSVHKLIRCVSKYSFGIYFSHVLFINLLYRLANINTLTRMRMISIPAITVFVFICSFITSYCVSKIPLIGKNVV